MRLRLLLFFAFMFSLLQEGSAAVGPTAATLLAADQQAGVPAAADTASTDLRALEAARKYQQESIGIEKFDEAAWRKIVGNTQYNEADAGGIEGFSIPWAGPLIKILAYAVIVGAVVLLLYLVMRNVVFDVKIKRSALNGVAEDAVENIEEVDIASLLDRAIKEGDLRMAVRLYYLSLLKRLHALEIIDWKKDKTNRDYLSELFARNFYFSQVRRLTILYEAVWYGERDISATSFKSLSAEFESVFEMIKSGEAS